MSENLDKIIEQDYEHGFVTNIEAETIEAGLNEDVIRLISARKNEPEFFIGMAPQSLSQMARDEVT